MGDSLKKLFDGYREGYALPGAVYRDPEIYELEIRHIMLKSWLYVGHASQVPERGDYFLFEIAGESVIVVRDAQGGINALMNVCRHRGSRICDTATGHESRLTCRYHGWTYGLDGSLKAAARVPEGFDKSKYGLRRLHARVFEGLIFVNFDENPPDFGAFEREMAAPMRPYGLDKSKVAHCAGTIRSRATGSSRSRTTASAITASPRTPSTRLHMAARYRAPSATWRSAR